MRPVPPAAPPEVEFDFEKVMEALAHRKWIMLAIWALAFSGSILYSLTARPVYRARALLNIEKERGSGGVIYSNGAIIESKNDDYYQTQYKLLQSYSLTEKAYRQLGLENHPDFGGGVELLQEAVAVQPVLRSRLVYVTASSFDPELAARISNTLSETFVTENLTNQLFISKDILQALQSGSSTRRGYDSLPTVVNNTLIQNLKGDLAKLESQAAELSQKVTDKHPSMIAVRSNIASLRTRVSDETDRIVASLKAELSGQLRGNNVRIVDRARVPGLPSAPNKRQVLTLGFFAGLILGMAVALGVDAVDRTIRTQKDVERSLNLPFLGLIPAGPPAPNQRPYAALTAAEPSLTSESLRNLRTMIEFAGLDGKAKVLMVTSSVQEEGKTHVSANLAVAYAQTGEKVLLIDGDLRRSRLHRSFRLPHERGLSQFLASGQRAEELEGLLQETDVEGLKLLVCGVQPPNPAELLNTPRVGAVISWASSHFDRVILDSTPLFPINDSLLWGRHVRSAIFVVRYGKTRTPLVHSAVQKLSAGGVKVLGIALNMAKMSSLTRSGYGRYYANYHRQEAEEPRTKTA